MLQHYLWLTDSVQFSLVAQSCPTHCDPMDCIMPGFSDELVEFKETDQLVHLADMESHPPTSLLISSFHLSDSVLLVLFSTDKS